MPRDLYIVSRTQPLLLGSLQIMLEDQRADGLDVDIILDRRRRSDEPSLEPRPPSAERRRRDSVDRALRSRGYAMVRVPDVPGERETPPPALDETQPAPWVPDTERWERSILLSPGRRAWRLAVALVAVIVGIGIAIALVWGPLARIRQQLAGSAAPIRDQAGETVRRAAPAIDQATSGPAASPPAAPESPTAPREPAGGPASSGSATSRPAAPPQLPAASREASDAPASATAASPPEPAREQELPPRPSPRAAQSEPVEAAEAGRQARALPELPPSPRRDAGSPASPAIAEAPGSEQQTRDNLSAFPHLPRVQLSREGDPSGGSESVTVWLADVSGRPLPGAEVWIHQQREDGSVLRTRLEPASAPGIYQGRLSMPPEPRPQLTVRVVLDALRFEVPVTR